jgi:tagaturonate epimerase
MATSTFPFSLAELKKQFAAIISDSYVEQKDAAFWLQGTGKDKQLAVLARPGDPALDRFTGKASPFQNGYTLKICPLVHANARALRATLDWLTPKPIGLATSAGMGDRIGLATPGHVRAVRAVGGNIVPIFAQQSIREMQRTGRSPDDVMTDATWGMFEAGWRGLVGADADHLKSTEDIDACVAAGYSFYTVDPGAHVDSEADTAPAAVIQQKLAALPWKDLETSLAEMEKLYVGQSLRLEDRAIQLDASSIHRAAVKYGKAIAHVAKMYRHLVSKKIPFEFEVSVDETETPTTHVEHVYVASELKRLGAKWVSLAPRYIGRFEKGVDYIGDVAAFESDFAVHAQIARKLGPYKLSLHSGSDKYSVYPAAMRQTHGMVHLKTAGTSYLEALHTIAQIDPVFFRKIYVFAREHYDTDKLSYHVSAELSRAPKPEDVKDADLPELLDQFDAREIFHVTFGSVLTTKKPDGHFLFYDEFMAILRAHPDAYAANLEKHFVRHLKPFASKA